MKLIKHIENVINSNVLPAGLLTVPDDGASINDICDTEKELGVEFSEELKKFLRRWNGIHLDVLNIYGCNQPDETIKNYLDAKETNKEANIPYGYKIIGDDPSGFLYLESNDNKIFSYDIYSGDINKLASNFEDFICRLVFGKDSDKFIDEEWKSELENAGLI